MHLDALRILLTNVCSELNKEFRLRNRKLIYHPEGVSRKAGRSLATVAELAVAASQDMSLKAEIRSCYSKLNHNLKGFEKAHPAYAGARPAAMTDGLITQFVKYLQTEGKASKTINDLVWSMGKLAKRLRAQGISVPAVDYEQHRVQHIYIETNKYIPLTHAEKERAFSYFREHSPEYYMFLLFVYYTCIRPAELCRLQVKQIDLSGNKIHVPWFSSKNGLSNYVQILEPLRQALQDYGIDMLDKDMYLFAGNCKPGKEMSDSKMIPKIWHKHREKLGMATGKSAYGLKHTFNIDYVENNKQQVDWEWLRRHNRHATVMQTQQYISGLTAYFIDETKHVILNYHK
jgi:integrase